MCLSFYKYIFSGLSQKLTVRTVHMMQKKRPRKFIGQGKIQLNIKMDRGDEILLLTTLDKAELYRLAK